MERWNTRRQTIAFILKLSYMGGRIIIGFIMPIILSLSEIQAWALAVGAWPRAAVLGPWHGVHHPHHCHHGIHHGVPAALSKTESIARPAVRES